jgi:transcriptional regulator NrdR family protein
MIRDVIKKDGTKQLFQPDKIRRAILASADQAGVTRKRAEIVAKQVMASVIEMVSTKKEITSAEIREKALMELDIIQPSIAEVWRQYTKE